jgi:DNA modification methylase
MTAWTDERKKPTQNRREIPKMPEGYYSGDKPNPNLRPFVEAHLLERPYDPKTDKYEVPAFDHPIETTKTTAIYNMHTYWSKKPHDAIRQYIRHYTKPGDLVLDPFCGSGGTALAALMEGRKAIAIDRSPAATFITKNYCTPVDVEELKAAFEELKKKVKPEIDWLYETRCDRCGGKATTAYTIYSQVFQCPRCMEKVALFDCPEAEGRTQKGKPKKIRVCPHCQNRGIAEEISTSSEKFGSVPVMMSYICENGCKPARIERRHDDLDPRKREFFEKYDLEKIREIEKKDIPYWYPKDRMMHAPEDQECWGVKWRAGTSNFRTVDELFTKRNLWALAAILDSLMKNKNECFKDLGLFALTAISLGMSKMNMYRFSKVTFPTTILKGTYYIPQIIQEEAVLKHWSNKTDRLLSIFLKDILIKCNKLLVDTRSSCDLSDINSNSIDYIFTDPPYADKIQYGELNFIWESLLGLDNNWHNEEIIVNEIRGKTEEDWAKNMLQAMEESHRVLKPGRWLSLCYHDTSEGTWALIQDIMAEAGFIVDENDMAIFIDTGGSTFNQRTADKVNKRDLIINFRKPKLGEAGGQLITDLDDFLSFQEKVRNIIADYLSTNPGSTKDRIYDEVVSRMVRRGQMEAHHFDDLLSQVAEPVYPEGDAKGAARWYLKDTEIVDSAESAKEDEAAASVGKLIAQKKKPEDEGVHYSDIFEHYIYAIPAKDKPRRPLVEWLLDYFYKTDDGTYRLPASEEEEQIKKEGRTKGVGRSIKRYLSYLDQGVPVPARERPDDATLADWIRHAKRSGMYLEGRLLYERGGLNLENLSELGQVNADEDYQICVTMLSRDHGPEKKTRKTKKVQEGLESWQ